MQRSFSYNAYFCVSLAAVVGRKSNWKKELVDGFHGHVAKKQIWNRSVEEAKKMKCYKTNT